MPLRSSAERRAGVVAYHKRPTGLLCLITFLTLAYLLKKIPPIVGMGNALLDSSRKRSVARNDGIWNTNI